MNELILMFAMVTQTYNLPPKLLSGICYVESGHKVKAINVNDGGADSLGVCQIKLETAKLVGYRGTAKELHHSAFMNISYAGKYLRKQLDRYHDDVIQAVAAYNAGCCRFNAKGQIKNRLYVAKVLKAWADQN